MPDAVLLLRLEGPLQSWGERARWDVRDSASEPTKSGVLGLLGAALGLRRGDQELVRLDIELRFGVRVDKPGTRLFDFHTVTGLLPSADGGLKGSAEEPYTIVSHRAYLQDASFLVGLEGEASLLERCHHALKQPIWPYYLGRKCCPPTRPVAIGIVQNSLEAGLREAPIDEGIRGPLLALFEDDSSEDKIRRDRLTARPSREYADNRYRVESIAVGGVDSVSQSTVL